MVKEKKNKFKPEDHTFAICAYKESQYLEECILSLMNQNVRTNIIMVTSTPNHHIEHLAEKYKIPYYINKGESGIAQDWNFAYSSVKTKIITIAHQDDIYEPDYAQTILQQLNMHNHPLIAFTNYGELRNDNRVIKNRLLTIKRILLSPLKIKKFRSLRFVRRRILSIGSPICCPSVTMVKSNLPKVLFTVGYRSNIDWQAWERISLLKGEFVYCKEILMFHRIHQESETSLIIADHDRTKEDFDMFCLFWPKWIARIIEHFYRIGEESNEV